MALTLEKSQDYSSQLQKIWFWTPGGIKEETQINCSVRLTVFKSDCPWNNYMYDGVDIRDIAGQLQSVPEYLDLNTRRNRSQRPKESAA